MGRRLVTGLGVLGLAVCVSGPWAAARPAAPGSQAQAATSSSSLYTGPGPRPGPSILYAHPVTAPELTNGGIWHAAPILVSGAFAYRDGEFLYQDWLYDDNGARETPDPNDPRTSGNLFSKPNGTYTYPTGPGYHDNAADLVEFRVKPTARATAFRITLNTLENPRLIAFSIAIGGRADHVHRFPDGANVSAPASLFLTVHPGRHGLVGTLVHAGNDKRVRGPAPRVRVDRIRHQITVLVPHSAWNPRRDTVRLAMGVGLWNGARHRYLLPGQTASATMPGGAGTDTHPAAFFNVAFRSNRQEPLPSPTAGVKAIAAARWWRDAAQGTALAQGNISRFYADVSFAKLWRGVTDNSKVPRTGPMDRIMSSHFQVGQGEQFANQCGLQGASKPKTCRPEYLGRLQPYAIYVPRGPRPRGGWGLTLLLHSLSANYNQYTGSRNQRQFALRAVRSIVITPEARGPDQFYEGLGEADVFEAWADVAHLYRLNPDYADLTGYSMGGIGTFDIGAQFPDLFARAQPTVGDESNNNVLGSFRNLPVLMWNVHGDELVGDQDFLPTAQKLEQLGYRVTLHAHLPCVTTLSPLCSPALMDHLELAINDWFLPAARFLGHALVPRNPPHVTFVVDGARDSRRYGIVANHAYWVSGLKVRRSGSLGTFDAISQGFGLADPKPSGVKSGSGALVGGHLGPIHYTSQTQTWGPAKHVPRRDRIEITASNIAQAVIDVSRAHVSCQVKLVIHTDGPITIRLPGCRRVVRKG
ncbi:MAG TPA: glucodextranase DOMON-like domain-containing protein [Solirubrobacteraceae bacterium]|nr:glucodextranase DOMON-like domain-containing protein [Solirubrobacteraceae bacterium]